MRCLLVVTALLAASAITAFADDTRPFPATTRTSATLPTAAEVIDRYIAVTGGIESHRAVRSRQASGLYVMPDLGLEGSAQVAARSDGAALLVIDLPRIGTIRQGVTADGIVWSTHPSDGPRLLTDDEAAGVRRTLSLDPNITLDGYRNVDVVDLVPLNGRPSYRMDLTSMTGVREQRFFDVESGLLVRTLATTPATRPSLLPGGITVATFFSDYADVPPIRLPLRVRQGIAGLSPELILKRVEHNVDLPDDLFAPPAEVKALMK